MSSQKGRWREKFLRGLNRCTAGLLQTGVTLFDRSANACNEAIALRPAPPGASGQCSTATRHMARGPSSAHHTQSNGSSVVLLITSMEKLALTSSRSTAPIRRR